MSWRAVVTRADLIAAGLQSGELCELLGGGEAKPRHAKLPTNQGPMGAAGAGEYEQPEDPISLHDQRLTADVERCSANFRRFCGAVHSRMRHTLKWPARGFEEHEQALSRVQIQS